MERAHKKMGNGHSEPIAATKDKRGSVTEVQKRLRTPQLQQKPCRGWCGSAVCSGKNHQIRGFRHSSLCYLHFRHVKE